MKIPASLSMGPVALRVRNGEQMLSFYVNNLGLKVKRKEGNMVELAPTAGSKQPILVLVEDPNASKASSQSAGLYHFAILLPDRKSLAEAYLSIGNSGIVFDGYADHLVSEALYLTDPAGNGIEIYADRPREKWKFEDGGLRMATEPLDIDSLLGELPGGTKEVGSGFPEGTQIGHVHLKVTDISKSVPFYRDILGFDLMSFWSSAAFLSAGGYHHHIGMNTWESYMGKPHSAGEAGLESFTLKIPDGKFVSDLSSEFRDAGITEIRGSNGFLASDPDGIRFLVEE